MLALRRQLLADKVAGADTVLLHEILHGVVDAEQVSSWHWQVARLHCTGRDDDRVIARLEVGPADVDADLDARTKARSLGLHLREARLEVLLLHLEVGDAVAQ